MTKRVILHYDTDFVQTIYVEEGADVQVLCVCDWATWDRVYRATPDVVTTAEIDALIGDSPIGHKYDDRHPALAARVVEVTGGPPRLRIVKPEEPTP